MLSLPLELAWSMEFRHACGEADPLKQQTRLFQITETCKLHNSTEGYDNATRITIRNQRECNLEPVCLNVNAYNRQHLHELQHLTLSASRNRLHVSIINAIIHKSLMIAFF